MSRDINPFGLRMPPKLREKVQEAAEKSGRSMNAELVHRIEASFDQSDQVSSLTISKEKLEAALERIHELTGLAADVEAHREEIDRKVAEMNKMIKERKAK